MKNKIICLCLFFVEMDADDENSLDFVVIVQYYGYTKSLEH